MTTLNTTEGIFKESDPENPNGFVFLLSTSTIFAMDLIGKNLQMNGIDAQWNYADVSDTEHEPSRLFVKMGQHEQALSILTSLDLLDFTIHHGK